MTLNELREKFEKEKELYWNVHKSVYILWLEDYIITNIKEDSEREEHEPYFGWCDVEGCENEGCAGGVGWNETGHWTLCSDHMDDFRKGKKQPVMKRLAYEREDSRDKTTGYLPIGWNKEEK